MGLQRVDPVGSKGGAVRIPDLMKRGLRLWGVEDEEDDESRLNACVGKVKK